MPEIQTFNVNDKAVKCYVVDGEPWFKGNDVASILEQENTQQALRVNVQDDDKINMNNQWTIKPGCY